MSHRTATRHRLLCNATCERAFSLQPAAGEAGDEVAQVGGVADRVVAVAVVHQQVGFTRLL